MDVDQGLLGMNLRRLNVETPELPLILSWVRLSEDLKVLNAIILKFLVIVFDFDSALSRNQVWVIHLILVDRIEHSVFVFFSLFLLSD